MPAPIQNPSRSRASFAQSALDWLVVAASSILFCSKGVVAKLAFAHGVDALTVLTLRMGFALPFFALIAMWRVPGTLSLTGCDWLRLAGLGFLGYYFSSLVNFTGLQHVTVALERVILYTYPSLVLAISALALRKRVRWQLWVACLGAWIGIVFAFAGERGGGVTTSGKSFGAILIFCSALSYAIFLMLSAGMIRRAGALRFTGIAVGFSCAFMLIHYAVVHRIEDLLILPSAVYSHGLILAIFGTLAPAILMSFGLRRAGVQRFAIISTIGPVTTLVLAWAVLSEVPTLMQGAGFLLTLASGVAISVLKEGPKSEGAEKPVPTRPQCSRSAEVS